MGCGASSDKNAAKPGDETTLVIVVGSNDDDPTPRPLQKRAMSLVRMDMAKMRQEQMGGERAEDVMNEFLCRRNSGGTSPKNGLGAGLHCSGSGSAPRGNMLHRRRTVRMHEFSETVGQLVVHNTAKQSKLGVGKVTMEDTDDEQQKRLDRLFALMDVDSSGSISLEELREGFKKIGWAHSPQQVTRMFGLHRKSSLEQTDVQEIDRPTFNKLFRSLTNIEDLVVGAEMDASPTELSPASPRRDWKPGSRPLLGYKLRPHQGHRMRAKCVSLSPVARVYTTSQREDSILYLHDLDTGEQLRTFQGHQDAILCCAMSTDRKHVATASRDGLLILYDATCGHVLKQLEHPGVVTCCSFSPNGKHIYTGCHDSAVRKFEVNRGRLLVATENEGEDIDLCGHLKGVVVTITAAPRAVALSRARERAIEVLDSDTLALRHSLQGHDGLVWALSYSTEHRFLVSTCERYVRVWDIKIGGLERMWKVNDVRKDQHAPPKPMGAGMMMHRGPAWITSCFCPGDFAHLIAAVCNDLSVTLLQNKAGGAAILTVFTKSPVYCISASRDYTELALGDEFGNVYRFTLL